MRTRTTVSQRCFDSVASHHGMNAAESKTRIAIGDRMPAQMPKAARNQSWSLRSQALGERASSSRRRDRASHYIGPALSLGQSQIRLRNWSFSQGGMISNSKGSLCLPLVTNTSMLRVPLSRRAERSRTLFTARSKFRYRQPVKFAGRALSPSSCPPPLARLRDVRQRRAHCRPWPE